MTICSLLSQQQKELPLKWQILRASSKDEVNTLMIDSQKCDLKWNDRWTSHIVGVKVEKLRVNDKVDTWTVALK